MRAASWASRGAVVTLVALVGLIGSGCADREAEAEEAGSAAARPASSGEMCVEHGVLEAVCTKCNPKLIPVFQAKGDWCAEHGFPESFCPVCHPERGGRPAAAISSGDADQPPPDRLKVRLASPEIPRIVGIATEKGVAAGAPGTRSFPARLAYDASKRAEINARSAGVVRSVLVDVGSRVARGAPLVVLDSPEVGADRSRLIAARKAVEVARAALERQRALHGEGIAPLREVQEAEGELASAEAEVRALEVAGGIVGSGGASGRYTLHAPLAGVVVRRAATIGRQVHPEEVLLEVVDASVLWAEIDVPEASVGEVSAGDPVTLTFDGLAGRAFHGTLASVAPEVDPRTRTAMARVRLANPDGALRANMYGRAILAVGGAGKAGGAGGEAGAGGAEGAARTGVRVPRAALQRANGAEVVFVRLSDTLYETRRVETGARTDGWVEVTRGLAPGEDVVTVGSFLLKTETLKGSIGAGCCEVE
jgi:cobalt-zinc-cadmium efflux system membrane fusion protein